MKIFRNNKLNNTFKYIMPSVVTAIIFCVVLLIKGIYPFGKETIDYYDLSTQALPVYLHTYDVYHGVKSLFYDTYSALSTNMAGVFGVSVSPLNLLFFLTRRANMAQFLSVLLLIKLAASSLAFYIFIHDTHKIPYKYELIFSVCYGLSGYIMINYVVMSWIDHVIYFPLIMLGLKKLLKDGSVILYTVMLTIALLSNAYLSFMVLIYVFLFTGMLLITIRKDVRQNIFKLGVFTVLSALLSSVALFPQLIHILGSARFSFGQSGGLIDTYMDILKNVSPVYTSRWFILLTLAFPSALIMAGLFRFKSDKRLSVFTICMLVISCAGMIFENVSLMWHYGSYVHYPQRNGFMIVFTFLFLACIYIEKMEEAGYISNANAEDKKSIKYNAVKYSIICLSFAASILGIAVYANNPGMSLRSVFHLLAIVSFVAFVMYILMIVYKNGCFMPFVPVVIVCGLLFYGFIFLGEPAYVTGYTEEPEMEKNSSYICNRLYDEFGFEALDKYTNITDRVKNPDVSLNANYPLVLRRSALSNWTSLISTELQAGAKRLGYSSQFNRLLDSGGTVFSDALLGVKNIISCIPQDEKMYELIDTAEVVVDNETGKTDKYYYYKCKYELPWGVKLHATDIACLESDDIVELYNNICFAICKNEIASYVDLPEPVSFTDGKRLNADIMIDGSKALYYLSDQIDTDDYNTVIKVNSQAVSVPSILEKDNTLYPAHFNNNALYLGTYDNEEISVDIDFSFYDRNGDEISSVFNPRLMTIDLDMLKVLCEGYKDYNVITDIGKARYELSITSEENGYVMFPLSLDSGYTAVVNGSKYKPEFISAMFMAVPVQKGQNDIIIKYMAPGLKCGAIITVISAIFLIAAVLLYCIFKKRTVLNMREKAFAASAKMSAALEKIYIFAWCCVILLMYIIPIIYAVVTIVL